jgi:hypothetical protein
MKPRPQRLTFNNAVDPTGQTPGQCQCKMPLATPAVGPDKCGRCLLTIPAGRIAEPIAHARERHAFGSSKHRATRIAQFQAKQRRKKEKRQRAKRR